MSQNSQLHLTNDSFLYACQSEFAARTKKDGSFKSHIRFEAFLVGEYKRPTQATLEDFAQLISNITAHHFKITPQFRRKEPLNLETVSYFTCAVATLFADLETACKEMFGRGLPTIPSEPPEYSAEAPISKALLHARNEYLKQSADASVEPAAFETFPIQAFGSLSESEQVATWACEVWDCIADAIHKFFTDYADMAMGFAYWKYQETQERAEIDWRVRPPVGEAYAKAFKPMQRNARNERTGGDRGSRDGRGPSKHAAGGKDRGRHMDTQPRDQVPAPAPATGPRKERMESHPERKGAQRAPQEFKERPQRNAEHRFDAGQENGPQGRRDMNPVTSEKSLEEALQEVHTAAATLRDNPKLKEVALKPSNSFVRRQQHSLAVELGFDTESRGEGRSRGVVIRLAANPA